MKNRAVKAVSATFAILFACVGNSFAQDWAVNLVDDSGKTSEITGDWKLRVGRILTSNSQLTNSSRLLRNTRYRRVPVGLFGWGGQAKWENDSWSTMFDITSRRSSAIKDPHIRGVEVGSRIQFNAPNGWFLGANFSYDFESHQNFLASDIGYKNDNWDLRLAGYSLDDDISGAFIFAQYKAFDWLYLDAGLDYRSDRDSLEKLFGVRFYFENEKVDFIIDYIHDGNRDRGETLRGRFQYRF